MTGFVPFVIIAALTTVLVMMKLEPSQPPIQKKQEKKLSRSLPTNSWILLDPGVYWLDGKKLIVKKRKRINLHGITPLIVPK